MIPIYLNKREILEARDFAEKRYQDFKDYFGEKYKNTPMGHFIGALGEYAVCRWAEKCNRKPLSNFKDNNSKCDVFFQNKNQRIEVKTWNYRNWIHLGHAISIKDYNKVDANSDRIIWATVRLPNLYFMELIIDYLLTKGEPVYLMGWNFVEEFESVPPMFFKENGEWSKQISILQVRPMELFDTNGLYFQEDSNPFN